MSDRSPQSRSTVFLMYHELELPGRALVETEPGYVRYILSADKFRSQIEWLKQQGWRGLSVSEALRFEPGNSVAVTFDDGCETDLIAAAPILKEAGFGATFYVTAGRVDAAGFLSRQQLRELDGMGFEIGCHSMTHAYLNDIGTEELRTEIAAARRTLRDFTGSRIDHFSCPGGRYDERALAVAREAGYRTVTNSRAYANHPATDPYQLGRVAIMRSVDQTEFVRICHGQGLWKMRLSETLRGTAKRMIGNRGYDSIRRVLLRRGM